MKYLALCLVAILSSYAYGVFRDNNLDASRRIMSSGLTVVVENITPWGTRRYHQALAEPTPPTTLFTTMVDPLQQAQRNVQNAGVTLNLASSWNLDRPAGLGLSQLGNTRHTHVPETSFRLHFLTELDRLTELEYQNRLTELENQNRFQALQALPFFEPLDSFELVDVAEIIESMRVVRAIQSAEAIAHSVRFGELLRLSESMRREQRADLFSPDISLARSTPLSTPSSRPPLNPEPLKPEERVSYTTEQYNKAAFWLQKTPEPLRHMEGYIQYLMNQSVKENEPFPAPLARTIMYDILYDESQPSDRHHDTA